MPVMIVCTVWKNTIIIIWLVFESPTINVEFLLALLTDLKVIQQWTEESDITGVSTLRV